LDGDDGLTGEVCDQLDLLLGEWPHFSAEDCNAADGLVLSEHRHRDQCANASEFDATDRQWIAVEVSLTLCKVRNFHRLSSLAAELGRVVREKLPFRRGIGEVDRLLRADDVLECTSGCGLKWSALPDEL